MRETCSTDYETYREIMHELLSPIGVEGLDPDTVKRLYESKAVYLENLRIKCFREINLKKGSHFTPRDYDLILRAIEETRAHLRSLILGSVTRTLAKRQVS